MVAPRKWTEAEDKQLREMVDAGCTKIHACEMLNRTIFAVSTRAGVLGLKFFANGMNVWSKEEDEKLKQLVMEGTPRPKIVVEMRRTRSAVQSRINRLGIGSQYKVIVEQEETWWTPERNKELLDRVGRGEKVAEIAEAMGATKAAVYERLGRVRRKIAKENRSLVPEERINADKPSELTVKIGELLRLNGPMTMDRIIEQAELDYLELSEELFRRPDWFERDGSKWHLSNKAFTALKERV